MKKLNPYDCRGCRLFKDIDDKPTKVLLTRKIIENKLKPKVGNQIVDYLVLCLILAALLWLVSGLGEYGNDALFFIIMYVFIGIMFAFSTALLLHAVFSLITGRYKRFSLYETEFNDALFKPEKSWAKRAIYWILGIRNRPERCFPLTDFTIKYVNRARFAYRNFEPYNNITYGELRDSTSNGDRFYIVSFNGKRARMMFKADMFELDDDLKQILKKRRSIERE